MYEKIKHPYHPLLIFAHLGEAKVFIKNNHLKAIPEIPYYYQGDDYNLLICGGNGESTLMRTTQILTLTHPVEVYNLGIAGGLDNNLKIDDIIEISAAYGYREKSPVFESFQLKKIQRVKSHDCISVTQPIKNSRSKNKLLPFAGIVDQELWWICYSSKHIHPSLPIHSIKMISDLANLNAKSIAIIKKKTDHYSHSLYQWAKENFLNSTQSRINQHQLFKEEIQSHLYFTVNQSQLFKNLFNKLILKIPKIDEIKKVLNWEEIKKSKQSPKQKTNLIIKNIEKICYIKSNQYQIFFSKFSKEQQRLGIKINFDPNLEINKINFGFEINSLEDWENKKNALKKISLKKVFTVLDGSQDVPTLL